LGTAGGGGGSYTGGETKDPEMSPSTSVSLGPVFLLVWIAQAASYPSDRVGEIRCRLRRCTIDIKHQPRPVMHTEGPYLWILLQISENLCGRWP
jgi:hypothetical protein